MVRSANDRGDRPPAKFAHVKGLEIPSMIERADSRRVRRELSGCYMAHLRPLEPDRGLGYYDLKTSSLRYYSDGGNYFYALDGGRPVFYLDKLGYANFV
jgi:hypothetical protein